jgi:hypothetical protein
VIERSLQNGDLQSLRGSVANGEPWLKKALRTHATAIKIAATDPDSAYVLSYDAARHACTALLIQQGLRPTTRGGHLVVDEAMRAQFGDTFRPFRALRIRRNELEYPAMPDDAATYDEVREAFPTLSRSSQPSRNRSLTSVSSESPFRRLRRQRGPRGAGRR